MRMAYLIMAHHDRPALERLLHRLLAPGSPDFAVVHADAASPLWRDLQARPLDGPGRIMTIADPVAVRWGHWSQVEADRLLIEAALAEGCDYAHVLSGVDWPAVGRDTIVADIAAAGAQACFIEALPGVQEDRMQNWHPGSRWLRLDPQRDRLAYAAGWELRRIGRLADRIGAFLGLQRSRPYGRWRKGSSWWSLPLPALQTAARELAVLRGSGRLRWTACADEHAVQSIIAASYAGHLHDNKRFIHFDDGASSPRTLVAGDAPAIRASGAWFFRKVDAATDPFFLDTF